MPDRTLCDCGASGRIHADHRTLSMMEYEDWRPKRPRFTNEAGAYVELTESQMKAYVAGLQNSHGISYTSQQLRPMTAEEMRGLQMSGQAGATSWLDSLLGPGLL